MKSRPTLSVVLPTYNCAKLMERHLRSMFGWLDLADEVIVVDSRSTDGTLELIKGGLRHPNLRIIERDRGLYESWNEGIAATKGDWIYISTAGDTIERSHLLHLMEIGEKATADVVISPPRFVDEAGVRCSDLNWPPLEIVAVSGRKEPFVLTAEAGFVLTLIYCPSALLGSSASNLYRGTHLRLRPFPAEFKGAGDSVWILRHAAQSRLCFTPQMGSTFCVHPKEEELSGERLAALVSKILAEKQSVLANSPVDGELVRVLTDENRLLSETQAIHQERRRLWHIQPHRLADLWRWTKLTLAYFGKRGKLGSLRRAKRRLSIRSVVVSGTVSRTGKLGFLCRWIRGKCLPEASYQPVRH